MEYRPAGTLNPYAHRNPERFYDAGYSEPERAQFPLPDLYGQRLEDMAINLGAAFDNEVLSPYAADAWDAYKKLLARAPGYARRAAVRLEVSDYLETVATDSGDETFHELGAKLRAARRWAIWGIDIAGELILQWDGRAGVVKLCPDDARDEGRRVADQYMPELEAQRLDGRLFRYAVFTVPNVPRGELAAGIKALYASFRERILYAKKDGGTVRNLKDPRRRFQSIIGALATVEAPLSGSGDWNIHLNVLLVCKGRPDYKALRAAWGCNVHFDYIRGSRTEGFRAALGEIVKYPLQAVSSKSSAKAAGGKTAAPALVDWPSAAFVEWWRAHKGLRRTRSWGCLYGLAKPEPGDTSTATWLGKCRWAASGELLCDAPITDTRRGAAALDLIQGNKSAGIGAAERGENGTGPPFH